MAGRILRWARRAAPAFALVLVVLAVAVGWLTATEGGRARLAAWIGDIASDPAGLRMTVGGIGPGLPDRLVIRDLRIADAGSVWLEVPAVRVDWSPSRLLFDRCVVASRIEVSNPRLRRLPAAGGSGDESATGLPRLPLEVTVESVRVTGARVDAAVAGQAATLDLKGDARLNRDGPMALNLLLDSLDDPKGQLDARLGYRPAEGILDIDLQASEPSGGFLAALLSLPADAGLHLTAGGSGPLDGWSGRLLARAGATTLADLTARIGLGERWRISLAGRLDPGPLLPPTLAPLSAGTTTTLTVEADPGGDNARLALDLATKVFAVRGEAVLARPDGPVEVTVRGRLADRAALASLVPGLDLDAARIELRGDGPLDRLPVSARVELESLAWQGITLRRLRLDADARPAGGWTDAAIGLQARLALAGADSTQLPPELTAGPLMGALAARLEAGAQHLAVRRMTLETPLARVAGEGDVDLTDASADAALTVAVPSLQPLSGLAGRPLRGAVAAEVIAAIDERGRAHVDLDAALDDLGTGDPALDELLAAGVRVSAGVDWSPDEGLRLAPLRATSGDLVLAATAGLAADGVDLRGAYDLRAGKLSSLSRLAGMPLAGQATAAGRFAGRLPDLAAEIDVTARDLRLAGTAIPRLAARGSARDLLGAPRGRVALEAESPVGPVRARGRLATSADGSVRLDGLALDLPGLAAAGALVFDPATALAVGEIGVTVADLSPFGTLAGVPLHGSGDGRVVLARDGGRQSVAATTRLSGVGVESLRIADVQARARARLGGEDGADLDLALRARDLAQSALRLRDVALDAVGSPRRLEWTAAVDGRLAEDFTVQANGNARPGGEGGGALTLAALRARAVGQDLRLNKPTAITFRDGGVELGPTDLAVGAGQFGLRARLSGDAIEADLRGQNLPLSLARLASAEAKLDGTLDLGGEIRLSPGADRADIALAARSLKVDLGDDVAVPAAALTASAKLADGQLDARAQVSGPFAEPLSVELGLPVGRPASGGLPAPVPGAPVAGSVTWNGDLAELEPLIPAAGHRLAGPVRVDLKVAGTLGRPMLTGRADLRQGRYENLTFGTRLTDLSAEVGAADRLRINASAGDGDAGRMTARAGLSLGGERPEVTARLELDSFRVVRRDDADALASGALDLTLAGGRGRVSGTVVLEPVEIRLLDNLPPSVVVLEITEDGDEGAGPAERSEPADEEQALALDIRVEVPRRAFVRGRGVDSEWRGGIKITGTAAEPRVDGAIETVRGQVAALGKVFRITRGTVTLDGATPPDPVLDLVAESAARDLTVELRVGGRASAPSIELASQPALPRDEILARLLFGKNAGALGPAEAIALGNAAASLAGGGGGFADKLRAASSLDVLRAETGDAGDPRLSAGKYISDGVYVGVNRGLDPGSGSVTIEIDVTRNISVESEIGSNATGNLGLNWTYDY